jgi:FkbM family methyltransferase
MSASRLKSILVRLAGYFYSVRRSLSSRRRRIARRDASRPLDPRLPADAGDCLVASNEHGLYCVPRNSLQRPVAQAICQGRVWEAETLDVVRGADSRGDIIHAGTYFGDFIPALARSRDDGALIWAFEPGRENHRCSELTIALNGLVNVRLARAGLSATERGALLATGDRAGVALGGASRVIADQNRARWFPSEEVALVTVDDVVGGERPVAAIQLDVEGHEQQALEGAMSTIERCLPLIMVETLPEDRWLAENLLPLGYRQEGRVNRNYLLRPGAKANAGAGELLT